MRRNFAIGQNLQCAANHRKRLGEARIGNSNARPFRWSLPALRSLRRDQILVCDEFVAVLLQDDARKIAPADDEDFFVVLFQFLDKRDEIAVTANNHKSIDVIPGKRHLERIERQIDIGAVLIAARRRVALHHLDGVFGELPRRTFLASPVGVGDFCDDLATFF